MKQLRNINVILYKNPQDPQFLLLRTSGVKAPAIWQGVTGKIEDADSSIQDAACREVGEELGFKVDKDKMKGPIHEFEYTTERKGYEGTLAHQYCFSCELPMDFKVELSREHQEYRWLPFQEAIALIDYENPKKALRITFDSLR